MTVTPRTTLCHCGKPLHYKNPEIEERVLKLIVKLGEFCKVTVRGRTWLVPRHFIALHGLKEAEIESLGFNEALTKQQLRTSGAGRA